MRHLDPDLKFIFYDHVKGHSSYGEKRTVPIRPEVVPAIRNYLKTGDSTRSLFFPLQQGPFVSQTFRVDKSMIVEGSMAEFDFRTACRTYAQYIIDEGFPWKKCRSSSVIRTQKRPNACMAGRAMIAWLGR